MVFGDIQCFCSILHTAITKTLIYVYSAPNPTLSLLLLFQMNTCYSNNHMPGDTTHRKPTTNCDGISLLFPTIYWFVVRLPKRCETVRAWLLCSLLILVIAMTASVVFFRLVVWISHERITLIMNVRQIFDQKFISSERLRQAHQQ